MDIKQASLGELRRQLFVQAMGEMAVAAVELQSENHRLLAENAALKASQKPAGEKPAEKPLNGAAETH